MFNIKVNIKRFIVNLGLGWAESTVVANPNFRTNKFLKDFAHDANARLAAKVKFKGGANAALEFGEDLMSLGQVYIDAYKGDGEITGSELPEINDACDCVIDRYVPNAKIEYWVTAAFAWLKDIANKYIG